MFDLLRDARWEVLRRRVLIRDRYICQYCGSNADLQVDHVWPRSKGGKDEMHNLVAACRSCNASKNGRTLREWVDTKVVITKPVFLPPAVDQSNVQTFRVITQTSEGKEEATTEAEIPQMDGLRDFAIAVTGGMTFSQNTAVETCGFLTRREFNTLRDAMMERGLCAWKKQGKTKYGVRLTDSGVDFLRAIATGEQIQPCN